MKTNSNKFRNPLPPDESLLEPSGQFAADLRNLRAAVHRAAERQTAESVSFAWLNAAKRRQRSGQRRLMLAWGLAATCATMLCIGTLPYLHHAAPVAGPSVAKVQPGTPKTDDTALLEQVDSAVSESVPSSLAPLATLDDWSSTASTSTESPLNTSEKKNVAQ
jgi:hypothetical protein